MVFTAILFHMVCTAVFFFFSVWDKNSLRGIRAHESYTDIPMLSHLS